MAKPQWSVCIHSYLTAPQVLFQFLLICFMATAGVKVSHISDSHICTTKQPTSPCNAPWALKLKHIFYRHFLALKENSVSHCKILLLQDLTKSCLVQFFSASQLKELRFIYSSDSYITRFASLSWADVLSDQKLSYCVLFGNSQMGIISATLPLCHKRILESLYHSLV